MLRTKIRFASLTAVVLLTLVAVKVAAEPGNEPQPPVKVEVQPKKGDQPRATTQPANIQAHESVRAFAHVSGYLKTQMADIGDHVKRGQVLAVLDVADLEAQVRYDIAAVKEARARLLQGKAQLAGAEAERETAKVAVKQAEEAAKRAATSVRYRVQQLKRMEDLSKAKSIEATLLEECKERHEAAVDAERSARTAIESAQTQVMAGIAKIDHARAGVAALEAGVMVAQASLEKSEVQLSYATISAPFDGVISQRGYSPGDFIRSADKRTNDAPLFTVQRTDILRVVVSIPERDVPLVDVGDATEVEVAALPGTKRSAKVSRMAAALDPKTHTMSVEIDLPNPTGKILPGMSGKVAIVRAQRESP